MLSVYFVDVNLSDHELDNKIYLAVTVIIKIVC